MEAYNPFQKAVAVWAAGERNTVNRTCVFTAKFQKSGAVKLTVTASSLYRVFLNGEFLGYGPARAAHGYFRVDEYALEDLKADNVLVIEVAGYNCNSFYTLNQPSFLQAEICCGDNVIAYTGVPGVGFDCRLYTPRIQKIARFSYQRAFLESYAFPAEMSSPSDMAALGEPTETEEAGYGTLLKRNLDYPTYAFQSYTLKENGKAALKTEPENFWRCRYLTRESLVIYPESEWQINAIDPAYNLVYQKTGEGKDALKAGEYALFENTVSLTGFIETKLVAKEDSLVYVLFDEVDFRKEPKAEEGVNVCFWRNDTLNLITYEIKKGAFAYLSFEAYTAKYIKVIVMKGEVASLKVGVRKYENPNVNKLYFHSEDEKLNAVVEAARTTLAQNSVDILTDCPSRERAGWLCDSYFSGQAEKLFTGDNAVERNFLENYALHRDVFEDGAISMCYPADFEDGNFIPNWMLYFLLELKGYYERTNDSELMKRIYPKAEGVLRYFKRFENEYGLLENLEKWVFVEWSKANDEEFIKGVNFPSNMLYAAALESFGVLFGQREYVEKAERLKEEIRRLSFNGELFEDNLVREKGKLSKMGHTTETCQYYAFYFGIADKARYPELYDFVFGKLGPKRDGEREYPKVFASNAFMGNLMRFDYLVSNGRTDRFIEESKEYYYKMANTTGTLWEHSEMFASLNHGFASYSANMIIKGLSGYRGVDEEKKRVYFGEAYLLLAYEIKIPTLDGFVEVTCRGGIREISLPKGYTLA